MTEEEIREFAIGLGVDDVGFAAAADYKSPLSPPLASLMPEVRSIVVLAFRELASCESPSPQMAMNGRLDLMEFARSVSYRVARFVAAKGARSMSAPVSYPLDMSVATNGTVGDVSLRHAAVAAGLGTFGRHNLVVHARMGSRVVFTAVLTSLDLPSDPSVTEDLCLDCDACVEACPASALSEPGKTQVGKCLKHAMPYGVGGSIGFWSRFGEASGEERKAMLKDPTYWRLYQAAHIGPQYFCFDCMKSCPVGQ